MRWVGGDAVQAEAALVARDEAFLNDELLRGVVENTQRYPGQRDAMLPAALDSALGYSPNLSSPVDLARLSASDFAGSGGGAPSMNCNSRKTGGKAPRCRRRNRARQPDRQKPDRL